jgi:hypothetical protein
MQKLKSIEALVKELLEADAETRNDDDYLYLKVCDCISFEKGCSLALFDSRYFLKNRKNLGFPPFETVRRSRQKIQRKFPELRANKEVTEQREDNEKVFREFIKEEVS